MIHICAECGFQKECEAEEFMQHIELHDEMDEIFKELGIEQEKTWDIKSENGKVILEIPSW